MEAHNITLADLSAAKRKMEADVPKILQDFRRQTGITPDRVHVVTDDRDRGPSVVKAVEIDLDMHGLI